MTFVSTDFLEEVGLALDLKGWGRLGLGVGWGLWLKTEGMVEKRQGGKWTLGPTGGGMAPKEVGWCMWGIGDVIWLATGAGEQWSPGSMIWGY